MTCSEFTEFLDAYLARELTAAEVSEFDRHLVVCQACVNYLATYRKTVELGKAAFGKPDEEVPPGVPEDLVRAILASRRGR